MSSDPISEQPPLERAIHRLKEAQNLHDNEEYDPVTKNMAYSAVDDALEAIKDYADQEMDRIIKETQ